MLQDFIPPLMTFRKYLVEPKQFVPSLLCNLAQLGTGFFKFAHTKFNCYSRAWFSPLFSIYKVEERIFYRCPNSNWFFLRAFVMWTNCPHKLERGGCKNHTALEKRTGEKVYNFHLFFVHIGFMCVCPKEFFASHKILQNLPNLIYASQVISQLNFQLENLPSP